MRGRERFIEAQKEGEDCKNDVYRESIFFKKTGGMEKKKERVCIEGERESSE